MHFFDLMQLLFMNGPCPGKSWKKDFRVLENPGIWSLLVQDSPGKKHFNVCTNPGILFLFSPVYIAYLFSCQIAGYVKLTLFF